MSSFKKQRKRLWLIDPHCHWCGIATVLPLEGPPTGPTPLNQATIDHLRPRHHPGRHEPIAFTGEVRRVLACWKCNNDRDDKERKELPKEWFYENGGSTPLKMRPLDELIQLEKRLMRDAPRKPSKLKRYNQNIEIVRAEIASRKGR